jgi:hypothetical protein
MFCLARRDLIVPDGVLGMSHFMTILCTQHRSGINSTKYRMQTLDSPSLSDLLDRLQHLRPETRALWGKMNAHQMVCHLTDSFGLAMGDKTASEEITFLSRTLVRWVALKTPLPWPKGVPTRPEMDQLGGGTRPTEFARDTAALNAAIRRFAQCPRTFAFARHPIFGELTEWEWMRWGYLHASHHFRQFGL